MNILIAGLCIPTG